MGTNWFCKVGVDFQFIGGCAWNDELQLIELNVEVSMVGNIMTYDMNRNSFE